MIVEERPLYWLSSVGGCSERQEAVTARVRGAWRLEATGYFIDWGLSQSGVCARTRVPAHFTPYDLRATMGPIQTQCCSN
jgi:hypothetical protein